MRHDVKFEPDLPLNNEAFHHKTANIQDRARLDISVNGFWGGRYEKCYIDVRVFNPFAPSNSDSSLQSCYRKHESVKKRAYEVRVREVEHSSFTPLVFAATGGMGHEASTFYKRLASLLSDKWKEYYAVVLGWIRCRLSFCYSVPLFSVFEEHDPPRGIISHLIQLTSSNLRQD